MPLDYLSDVKPLEDEGYTDAQIASYYSQVTAKAVSCGDAKVMLEEEGVAFQDPITGQLSSGDLIDYYNGLPDGQNKQLLAWFLSHVFYRGVEISSHKQPRAAQIVSLIGQLPGNLQQAGARLLELGGGQPYAGTVEADIAALRAGHQDDEAEKDRRDLISTLQAEIENTWINPAISDGVSTAEQVRAAIKVGL
jgi:hypothetical protein